MVGPRTRRSTSRTAMCGVLALWGAVWGVPVSAGTLQINPVLVEIGADRRAGSITLRNADDAPVTVRGHALAWSQQDGADRHEETSGIIISPPIFTIPPGGSQLIRVGLRRPDADRRPYRLILEEVPQAVPGMVQVALRLDLPLYASIAQGQASDLTWSVRRETDGAWVLEVSNRGDGYVRVTPELARETTGVRFENTIAIGTVLPRSFRRWTIGRTPDVENSALFQRVAGGLADVATASRRP